MGRCGNCGWCQRCRYLTQQAQRRQRRVTAAPKVRHQPKTVAGPRRKAGGRPPVITEATVRFALDQYRQGDVTWRQLGQALGVDYSGLRRRCLALSTLSDEGASMRRKPS